jgi:uncharacterized protein (TIGR03086 family)
MADQIQQTQRVLDGALSMIESASPAALSKPTPCAEWDARALIEHMIGVVQSFTTAFGGGGLTPPTAQGTAGLAGDNPASAYKQAADALMQAIRRPGALDQSVKLPFGEMPGNQAINIVIGDQSIHTWDLAKALGKPFTMDDDLASGILTMMHGLLTPERRAGGNAFAAEVPCPADAPVQDRLLAFSGRQP